MKHDLDVTFSLSDDDVCEFAEIWKDVYGETLPHAEARTIAGKLLGLYTILARPLPDELVRPEPSDDHKQL